MNQNYAGTRKREREERRMDMWVENGKRFSNATISRRKISSLP